MTDDMKRTMRVLWELDSMLDDPSGKRNVTKITHTMRFIKGYLDTDRVKGMVSGLKHEETILDLLDEPFYNIM